MSEIKAFEALSSTSRLKIVKLLQKKSLSVNEIAEIVNLKPITVRHHLKSLEDAGFIERYEEKIKTVGRPRTYYRASKDPTIVSYPKRRYLSLSNLMIKTLQSLVGSEKTHKILRKVGNRIGKNAIRTIEVRQDVNDWSLRDFQDFFINGYLEETGAEPEIVKRDKNQIVFRVHNCVFSELALKMPETICDVLHEAFHEGISSAVEGKTKITRLTCQGHGDSYCEHLCEWHAPS